MENMFTDSDPHYPHEDVMRLGATSSNSDDLRITAGSETSVVAHDVGTASFAPPSETNVVAHDVGTSTHALRDTEGPTTPTPHVKVEGKVVHVWADATFTATVEIAADTSRDPDVIRRLRLVAAEFEDRNRLKKIVERNRVGLALEPVL
jgi:hypothetical protein